MMAASAVPIIHTLFETTSGTWQYVVACPTTSQAVVIDPVLNFNAATNELSTRLIDEILALVKEKGYRMTHLLETHVDANHLTASHCLQRQLGDTVDKRPKTCIGKRIKDAQAQFGGKYGIPAAELIKAFDHLFEDGENFSIGGLKAEVLHLLGIQLTMLAI
jgi:glyoxylase-like metal-dependent hydrolase (beta-lactamase superfamily II)